MAIWLLAFGLTCSACDALVAPDYPGEPVIQLKGVAMSSTRPDQVNHSGVLAGALWEGTSYQGPLGFTKLSLRLEFPELFIEVLSKPSNELQFAVAQGEPTIAEGYLHIVAADTGATPQPGDFLATDYDHALVFVGGGLPSASEAAAYLGGSLAPGFHIMNRTATTSLTPQQALLVVRCVASAYDLPRSQAEETCTQQHLYRLDPAPDDLATILNFRLETPLP